MRKKTLLQSILCLAFIKAGAQSELWGTATYGGSDDIGVIYRVVNGEYQVVKHFEYDLGSRGGFSGDMLLASDDKLYGLTTCRVSLGSAIMVSYDPATNDFEELAVMTEDVGSFPAGFLVEVSLGVIMGVCSYGGLSNGGTLFSFDIAQAAFTKLRDMECATGCTPRGGLARLPDGRVIGATAEGGGTGNGVVFAYDPVNNGYEALHTFTDSIPWLHLSRLTVGSDGGAYGVRASTAQAGGILYRIDPANGAFSIAHDFSAQTFARPIHALNAGPDGALYGATRITSGGSNGSIYRYDPAQSAFTTLFSTLMPNLGPPACTPVHTTDGALAFHSATTSGPGGAQAAYIRIDAQSGQMLTNAFLAAFNVGEFSLGPDSGLYDIRLSSWTARQSIVRYDADGFDAHVVMFNGAAMGGRPDCHLILSGANAIIGACRTGGAHGAGALFKLDPFTLEYDTLFSFPYGWGFTTLEPIEVAPNQYLLSFSQVEDDLIVLVDAQAHTSTGLYNIGPTTASGIPGMMLRQGSRFYGVSPRGGDNNTGTLWRFDLSDTTFQVLYSFEGPNSWEQGASPVLNTLSDGRIAGVYLNGDYWDPYSFLYIHDPVQDTTVVHSLLAGMGPQHYQNGFAGEGFGPRWGSMREYFGWPSTGAFVAFEPGMDSPEVLHVLDDHYVAGRATPAGDGRVYYACNAAYGTAATYPAIIAWAPVLNSAELVHQFTSSEEGINLVGGMLYTELGVGVRETVAADGLEVFPNPAADRLRVRGGAVTGNVRIRVFDAGGRIMLDRPFAGQEAILDVSALAPGHYSIRVEARDKAPLYTRFVIAR